MIISVLKKGAAEVQSHWKPSDLPELLADSESVIWVDIDEWSDQTEHVLTDVFKFHPLSVEHAVETRNNPTVAGYPEYIFFTVHGVKGETNSQNFVTRELDGFLGSNYVVTYRTEEFRSITYVHQQAASSPYIFSKGADYLLYQILDQLVDQYIPVVDDFDDVIGELEERIFKMKNGDTSALEEIMQLKRQVGRLIRISSKQSAVLYRLAHGEFAQISSTTLPFYRDIYDHLQRVSSLAENYRDLIGGLMDIHLSVVANKTNEIMKLLAIFSAIMLPLTLIAGVFGMNTYLPGSNDDKSPRIFWEIVVAMVAISGGLLFYFWQKGWLHGREPQRFDQLRRNAVDRMRRRRSMKAGDLKDGEADPTIDSGKQIVGTDA